MTDRTFIETQFPVAKLSKESYKERKAGIGQTLTGLGKWWGRKPLILVRAAIIGLLMPASDDPQRDREIFLKILTMDNGGLWKRCSKSIPVRVVAEYLELDKREEYLEQDDSGEYRWKKGLKQTERAIARENATRIAFSRMTYDDKLTYCDRPEQIDGPSTKAWEEINAHLGTCATTLQALVGELGKRRFGHTPKVGDAFCGGGSIPFEAARLGCEAYGSDLNPVAALFTWASLNIVGGGQKVQRQIQEAQQQVYEAADKQITAWGIEHNDKGWRADAYLYCVEAKSPATGYWVPLAPSWVIAEKDRVCAVLEPNHENKNYDIEIVTNADKDTFERAKAGTIQNSRMVCPKTGQDFSMVSIRGDREIDGKTVYGLRPWENDDLVPRPDDTFQERLYCVRWVETYVEDNAKGEMVDKTQRHYCSATPDDLAREENVLSLLREWFHDWQGKGFIPSRSIERGGDKTEEPIRTRGWTYWHHLFNPRQLLCHGLLATYCDLNSVFSLINLGKLANSDSRLTIWYSAAGKESISQTFSNQALNPLFSYGARSFFYSGPIWLGLTLPGDYSKNNLSYVVKPSDARQADAYSHLWITDPPYADAINYHELTDFFLAWYDKHLQKIFPDWYTDTKKALAVQGTGKEFKQSMVEIYTNLAKHTPENGLQIVMFTHQDASVWADLGMILWAAGLKVTAAWTIGTETSSGLKTGNYVQGTVLLVLRKRLEDAVGFDDEIYLDIEDGVKNQLDTMRAIDDEGDPNFGDTDYQLAAYAAALRVLTQYSEIEGIDAQSIEHELFRERTGNEKSEFEKFIDRAVEIACNYLIPAGFDENHWKALGASERLYLKGLDMERHGEMRSGAYQELAKGFGVSEYTSLYANTTANEARFKTASEFRRANLGGDGFGSTLVRHALFAIYETVRADNAQEGLNWLRNELRAGQAPPLHPDYWNKRQLLLEILRYLSRFVNIDHMEHWYADSDAAKRLAGTVENDRG